MGRFTLPRDLYHGKGSLAELKNLKGKKAIIVVGGGSMKRFGFLDKAVNYLKEAGMEGYYTEHGLDLFPANTDGVPFTTAYISSVGDVIANITEDMAAEQKARAIYEHLIDLANDEDVIGPLLFLRQREVVHYNRFKELLERYKKMGY